MTSLAQPRHLAGTPAPTCFRVFRTRFAVACRSRLALDLLGHLYGPPLIGDEDPGSERFLLVRSTALTDRGWDLYDGERLLAGVTSLGAALNHLERAVCSRIIASHPDLIAVHGATVLKHGVAALICGRSGAGKSTLSLALAARGFQVGGDDVALLDPRERTIRPVPRCFHLDARSRRLLRNLGLVMPSRALRYRFMTPADLGVTSPPAAPVRLIIFLDRGTRREGRLRTLSQAEMMARLLSETPRGPHSPSQIMEALGPLVSGAACFQLTGGRLSDNAGTVVTLLSQA